jgi:hypothetical protein
MESDNKLNCIDRIKFTLSTLTAQISNFNPVVELSEGDSINLDVVLGINNGLVRFKIYYEMLLLMLTKENNEFAKILEFEFTLLSVEEKSRISPQSFNQDYFLAVDKFIRNYICMHIGYFCHLSNRHLFEDWKAVKGDLVFLVE